MIKSIGRLFLAAALLLGPLVGPAAAHAETGAGPSVIISEVGWAGSSVSASDEWLELTNLTGDIVDLSGWTISGAATSNATLTIPDGSAVAAYDSFLITNYASDNANSAQSGTPGLVTASLSLSNSSLSLVLYDRDGTFRDAAGDGTAPLAGGAGGGGSDGGGAGTGTASMVRTAPVGDGTLESSWADATESSGFDAGAVELGTPGAVEPWFARQGETAPAADEPSPLEDPTAVATEEPPVDEAVAVAPGEIEGADDEEPPEAVVPPVEADVDQEDSVAQEENAEESALEPESVPEPEPESVPEPESESEPAPEAADAESTEDSGNSPEPDAPAQSSTTAPSAHPVGTLIVNELMSDAEIEWIEIYNPYNNVIPLSGWTVRDASGKSTDLPDQLLGFDQYVVVSAPLGKLNNDADRVELIDATGATIDTMSYGTDGVHAAEDGDSLARGPDETWRVTTVPTPGSANLIEEPAAEPPKERSSSGAAQTKTKVTTDESAVAPAPWSGPTTVRLSELYPNTAGGDLLEEFIEIENVGPASVAMRGWTLTDSSGKIFRFGDSTVLSAGETVALSRAETKLTLNNASDTIALIAPDESVVDSRAYDSSSKGSSLARVDAQWVWTRTPTPGQPNVVSGDDASGPESVEPAPASVPAARVAPASAARRSVTERIEGVVLVEPGVLGKQIFYISTDSGGIQVYNYDAEFPEMSKGDRVSVTGTMSENRGEPRIKLENVSGISVVGSAGEILPTDVDISTLNSSDHGRLIRVAGIVLSRNGSTVTLEHEGARIEARIGDETGIDLTQFARGTKVELAGILTSSDTGIRVLPRSPDDVTFIPVEPPATAATAAAGTDAQSSGDRGIALLITAGVVAGLGIYSARRMIRPAKLWYAKSRTLRAAAEAAH